MAITVNKIYSELFGRKGTKDWEAFRSTPAELIEPKVVDFSIREEIGAKKAESAAHTILQAPWGLYRGMRWLVQRLIMIKVYPVQNTLVKLVASKLRPQALDAQRSKVAAELTKKGFIVRHLWLERNGAKLSALMAIHPDHAQNGKWVLQACGNFQPIEYGLDLVAEHYHKKKFNALIINNPGVGKSEGTSTPETMGEAQALGITFLETALKAKKIALAGYSLGGGAMGQAILIHDFKQGVKYLVIRQMSFDKVSRVCEERYQEVLNVKFLQPLIKPVVEWAGCEMDSVAVSKKLQELKILEFVIQRVNDQGEFDFDGAIPKEAALAYRLHKEGVLKHKRFIHLPNVGHVDGDAISSATVQALHDWEEQIMSTGTRIARYFRSFLRDSQTQ